MPPGGLTSREEGAVPRLPGSVLQQEQKEIIEEIFVSLWDFRIPHRQVFKTDPAATVKIRPEFNCILKTGNSVSLNKAAYSGVNLNGDILDMLVSSTTNNYILLADTQKAFLMIPLGLDADRNIFCFLVRDEDRLHCYQYATLIFGFTSSSFVLEISFIPVPLGCMLHDGEPVLCEQPGDD